MVGHHSLEKYRYIKEVKPLAIISVAFLLIQALICSSCYWQQNSYVLALHFGISLISFSSVFVLMLIIFEVDKNMRLMNYL